MEGEILDISAVFSAPEYKRTAVRAVQMTEKGGIYVPYYENGELMGCLQKGVSPGMWVLYYSSGYVRVMNDDEFRREFELA